MKKRGGGSGGGGAGGRGKHTNKHGRKYKESDGGSGEADVITRLNQIELGDSAEGASGGEEGEDTDENEEVGSGRSISAKLFMWEFGQNDPKR
jgi:hypothetical protein